VPGLADRPGGHKSRMADQAQRERESREEDLNKFHQLREEQEEERAKLAEDLDEELEEEE